MYIMLSCYVTSILVTMCCVGYKSAKVASADRAGLDEGPQEDSDSGDVEDPDDEDGRRSEEPPDGISGSRLDRAHVPRVPK